jgi:predicted nucleic acid-binding protein
MMDAEPRFIDTNVLVYANWPGSVHHDQAVALLRQVEVAGAPLWINSQVLREYLAVVTRAQGQLSAVPMSVAIERVRFFAQRFWMAEDGPQVRARLLSLLASYAIAGKQVHDANLVASMLAYGVGRLLTFNVGDFRRFDEIITIETGPEA